MITSNPMSLPAANDADLVGASLSGNREAFGQIVARYQSLICSLAYSATGSLSQSEDLAQETFVAAWKQLSGLREPEKLRSWLCGIARNLIHSALRRQGREPAHAAESLDTVHESPSHDATPPEQAISKEEEAILWRAIERVPETYREPLILFYREHQSVAAVAEKLELSEETVHQRLSRGRKMLQEQFLSFVEGALTRTNPGPTFTLAVLAALPFTLASSAKAATVAAIAAKGGAAATGSTFLSVLSALLGPMIGVVCGVMGIRQGFKILRTPRERALIKRGMKMGVLAVTLMTLSCVALSFTPWGEYFFQHSPKLYILTILAVLLAYLVFFLYIVTWFNRTLMKIRTEEREASGSTEPVYDGSSWAANSAWSSWRCAPWEYRSRATFFGLPLVHLTAGRNPQGKAQPAVGWIASGERAYGILFASGGFAVGGISCGGCAIGLLSFGGFSAGLLAFGGFALGGVAMAGCAVGWIATGGLAIAWHAAMGGVGAAHDIAFAGAPLAAHANDAVARDFILSHPWLNIDRALTRNVFWLACFLPMMVQIVAVNWWRHRILRREKLS